VPPGVYVMTSNGEMVGRIAVHEDLITNCAFGGADGRDLYITAGKTLYQTRTSTAGQVAYPRWNAGLASRG
jgi:gluconolactonase